jgi:myo-inositol-1(or 4)-monophosphatase
MSPFLKTAIQAAKAAGVIHRRFYGKTLNIQYKGRNSLNLVTQVDQLSERKIISTLKKKFPTHDFLGEESGRLGNNSAYTWVIDPLDGTTNYAHSYPFFCVSIALLHHGKPIVAVVYDALRNECFTAEKNKGAFLNGKRLKVSTIGDLEKSLLCTGFAYMVRETHYNLDNFAHFVLTSQGVRRDGSAAMNLAYVAAGRLDGFWERGIQAWDMAAGVLLIWEAGGKVTDITGKPYDLFKQNALATNGKMHSTLLKFLTKGKDEKNWLKKYDQKYLKG